MISEAFASSETNNFGHLSTRVISRRHNRFQIAIDDPHPRHSAPSVSAQSSSHAERKLSRETF
ncbi:unnamed protein product, partial [Musa acuminata var. zebrina]